MIHIGTSGWSYDDWQEVLYPPGTPSAKRLDRYVERFRTVELNASFYHWPRYSVFEGWRGRLPDGFLMSVKAPRGLSHAARLREPSEWIERIERGIALLGDRFGVLLVQLPPDLEFDPEPLDGFLGALSKPTRVAVELRHPSWDRDETFTLLERHAAAYCVMSGANLACLLRITAPFVYVRMHGPDPNRLYAGSYPDQDLRWWADRIREWGSDNHDVFCYFNNDYRGYAVRNAETLLRILNA